MLSISYSFSPTTTILSSQVNQNFTDIVNYINNTACVTGMVMYWSGSVVTIPTGWALDTNSRDKFIIGAGNLYNVGATGGATTVTLGIGEIPSHNHGGNTGGQSANHTHTGASQAGDQDGSGSNGAINGGGTTSGASNDHTHSIPSQGGGGAHNNMPPYYAYCAIKKS